MPIVMPKEKPRELLPPGSHLGTCFRVIDLGSQTTSFGTKRQILFGLEFQDEPMSDGRPHVLSRVFTYSSDKKSSLRQEIESWLGRQLTADDFGKMDLAEMLGRTVLTGVKHDTRDGQTYAAITSLMKPPKSTPERLPVVNPAVSLSLDDRPFQQIDFDGLPEWLRLKIAKSPEYGEATSKRQAPATTSVRQRLKAHLDGVADGVVNDSVAKANDLDDEEIPF